MWDKAPSLFADVVERAAVKRSKDIATDMLTAVVDKMPVDSSQAVSNINLSLDAPNWTFVEGKTIGRSGAMAEGMNFIRAMPKDKLHSLYFTSAVPYMKYLENGHSRFAPNGVFTVSFLAISMFYR
jgi:hypothetical protein